MNISRRVRSGLGATVTEAKKWLPGQCSKSTKRKVIVRAIECKEMGGTAWFESLW